MRKKTIIIACSKFGNPVSNYFRKLGEVFAANNYTVIFIFDGLVGNLPDTFNNFNYFVWPSKRPIRMKDFFFFGSIISKYKPILCISNFGATNIVSLASFLWKVKVRMNYIHTTTKQLDVDTSNSIRTKLLRIRKRLIYNTNTHLLTNSEGNKTNAMEVFKIPENKIAVLPLLLKDTNISYVPYDQRNKSLIVVGRLDASKGHARLLRQFAWCLRKYPELQLKIVGTGKEEQKLIELTEKYDISKNVLFLGKLSNVKVHEEFSKSILGISSSIDEAYGLVNIEALREGTPIVCTKTAGTKDIVQDGVNGLFYDTDIKESLLKSIEQIFSNWDMFSQNARDTFHLKYNLNKQIEKDFDKIYENIKSELY